MRSVLNCEEKERKLAIFHYFCTSLLFFIKLILRALSATVPKIKYSRNYI